MSDSNLKVLQPSSGDGTTVIISKVHAVDSTGAEVGNAANPLDVAVAALPLPAGAALETGNLSTIATASGAPSDTAYAGTGATTAIGGLKEVYSAIKGTLAIRP